MTGTTVAPESIATALTTQLNALASGAYSVASGAIANETDLYDYIDLELHLASFTPNVTGEATVSVFLLPTLDASTYELGGGAVAPHDTTKIATFVITNGTGVKHHVLTNMPIPPLGFKLVAYNSTGTALAATGNTLKYRRGSHSYDRVQGITTAAVALDFGSISNGAALELTVAVSGAAVGDTAIANPNTTLEAGLVWNAYVSATDTVTIRLANYSAAPINPASVSWRATVIKH